jgi:hypothetical protein
MNPPAILHTLSLPIPWAELGFPEPLQTRSTALSYGDIGWSWEPGAPTFPVPDCGPRTGQTAPGWDLDHVVLLVPDIDEAVATLGEIDLAPRLRLDVRGRPTAFFRVGPVLEVIQSPVRDPALYGLALVTEEPLEVVVLRWRSLGREVTDPRPAIQPGRRIFTVRDTEAGLAVMSPDRPVPGT